MTPGPDDGRLLPPGARERFLDTPRGPVRVLEGTEGTAAPVTATAPATPLLLLHGGGSDHAAISWFELFAAVGARCAVYAPDLPGFGYTDIEPVGGPAAQADVVAEIAGLLGLERVVVVGVSMGGDVAMNLALRHPRLVAGLVLIAPGGLAARVGNRAVYTAAWAMTRLPDPVMGWLSRVANRNVERVLPRIVADVATIPAPVREEFAREARRRPTSPGYLRYNQAVLARSGLRNDLRPVVGSITVPTLFFHGADDPLVDPDGSREAAARMPRARLVIVPGCGHWAQLEAGERFRAELAAFREENEPF